MMRRFSGMFLVAAALVLAGAVLPIASVPSARAAAGCDLSTGMAWTPPRQRALRAEAFSHGPNCDKAVVVVVVRGADGVPLWVDARPAAHVALFAGVKTPREMQKAMSDWIRQDHMFKSSANLPAWPKGADQPAAGEFPFYVEAGVDRAGYEAIRAARAPLFCYVQGMESMACLVLRDGRLEKVGFQSFPG